ncbi:MAG TPA: tetratricopeptide repeat protein [Rhodanobacteraceae bacterium]
MITSRHIGISLLTVLVATTLVACAQPKPPAPAMPQVVEPSRVELVAAIRAAGAKNDSVIRVTPLRAPGVAHLLVQAHAQEMNHRYQAAMVTLNQALRLSTGAPDILQDQAELAVLMGEDTKAEALARQSFASGPKLGALCARNWQTVLEMRRIARDSAGVHAARQALARCDKRAPADM